MTIIHVPREFNEWELYEKRKDRSGCTTIIYGRNNTDWLVVRRNCEGPAALLYTEKGEIEDDERTIVGLLLDKLLRHVDFDVEDIVIEGDVSDAYEDARIQ